MKRETTCTGCPERYEQVADLLQRGEKEEAVQVSLKIDCEGFHIRAKVLIERSTPLR